MPELSHQALTSTSAPERRFRLGPLRIVLLTLLLIMVWAVSMVVFLPVGWAWQQASPYVTLPPQLRIDNVAGRVWDGSARVHWEQDLSLQLGWALDLKALRHGFLPLEWRLSTGRSSAEGSLTGTRDLQLRFLLRQGRFDLDEITRVANVDNVQASGVVTLESLFVIWSEDHGWSEATGRGHWPGGVVTWPMAGQIEQNRLPALKADMSMNQGDLLVRLQDQVESRTAISLVMPATEPVLEVAIRRHWLDLLGLQFGSGNGSDPDEVVFNVRHSLAP
ncbi:MAG: hypothetical protein EA349_03315 [Halomonadaceae bacterium]|nr:MAG: hypothetical protein EA349_03315 [Halomonadaceae bacterium]